MPTINSNETFLPSLRKVSDVCSFALADQFLLLRFTGGAGWCRLRCAAVRRWHDDANPARLGASSELNWWYTQVQEEPVALGAEGLQPHHSLVKPRAKQPPSLPPSF